MTGFRSASRSEGEVLAQPAAGGIDEGKAGVVAVLALEFAGPADFTDAGDRGAETRGRELEMDDFVSV